jgi:hypothetical protein
MPSVCFPVCLCNEPATVQLLAADIRLGELLKKLNEMEGNISSLNRRIMLLEVRTYPASTGGSCS